MDTQGDSSLGWENYTFLDQFTTFHYCCFNFASLKGYSVSLELRMSIFDSSLQAYRLAIVGFGPVSRADCVHCQFRVPNWTFDSLFDWVMTSNLMIAGWDVGVSEFSLWGSSFLPSSLTLCLPNTYVQVWYRCEFMK